MGASAPLQIGRYILYDEIASGGMAAVHFGRLVGTGGFSKTVAIKRLHRQFARTPALQDSILEEGRLAARIRHPNVVPPLDVLAESGELLLVMEYVHGEALSRLVRASLKAGERVSLGIGAAILSNVLHGLHAAHEAKDEEGVPLGIVHRDVSPQNVIVGIDGVARVIDFGIAKAVTSEENTTAGTIKGKIPYLAPEQLEGDPATRRTDIFAASVVFWEVLAGKRLFDGNDDAEVLRQIMSMPVPPPSAYNPGVPAAVDAIVARGLRRRPDERFATAREMALALEDAVPLATASMVGGWVERLATEALDKRAATLAQVEKSSVASSELTDDVDAPTVSLRRDGPQGGPPSPRPAAPPPSSLRGAPPLSARPAPPPPSSVRGAPPSSVRGAPPSSLRGAPPSSVPAAELDEPRSHPRPPPAGALRKPEIAVPNVDWLPPSSAAVGPPPETSLRKRLLRRALVALGVLALCAVVFAPLLVRAAFVAAAAERGITLTVDRVELSRREVRLIDVRATSGDLPGVSLHAGGIGVGLRHAWPDAVTFDDVELDVTGSYGVVNERLHALEAARGDALAEWASGLSRLSVSSARVEWKNVLGAGTSALLENVSVETEHAGSRALGDAFKISAPIVTLRVGAERAGPWRLEVGREGMLTRASLRFDPSGMYPANVAFTSSLDGATGITMSVPPTPLSDLRVPAALLGPYATAATRLEARGEVSVVVFDRAQHAKPSARTVSRTASGHVVVSAGSLRVFPGDPVDVSLDLPVSGDAARPIALAGTLAIAPADPKGLSSTAVASAALAGKLDLTGRVPRLELSGKSAEIACRDGDATALATSIAIVFDRLDLARVVLKPTATCKPRLPSP